ncbi:unnamed protein product [Hymenolepis diminuta]|nr:unnamed protein product [Hymenolepis diminuta]
MPIDVIKRCMQNLPNVKNVEGIKDYMKFTYKLYPKTLEKLHFGEKLTVESTKRLMLSDLLKDLDKGEYRHALIKKKYYKEAFSSMTYEEMAYVLTRLRPDYFLSEMPVDVIRRCVENLPTVKNVEGFNSINKFDFKNYPLTMRIYMLDKTKEETVENTKELMLSETFTHSEYYEAVCERKHFKEAFASMTYEEMLEVLKKVGEIDEFLSQMSKSVIKRCVENVPKVKGAENLVVATFDNFYYPKTLKKLYGDSTMKFI